MAGQIVLTQRPPLKAPENCLDGASKHGYAGGVTHHRLRQSETKGNLRRNPIGFRRTFGLLSTANDDESGRVVVVVRLGRDGSSLGGGSVNHGQAMVQIEGRPEFGDLGANFEKGGDAKRHKPAKYPDIENVVYEWFLQYQDRGNMTRELILEKSKKTMKLLYPQHLPEHNFSQVWLEKFKIRHGIKSFLRFGESDSVDMQDMEMKLESIREKVNQFSKNDVFNLDKTCLFYKLQAEKNTLWIIEKYAKSRCFKNINMSSIDCQYRANKGACMTSVLFDENVRWLDRKMNDKRILLMVDNCPALTKNIEGLQNLRQSNPEKTNVLDAINFVVSAWTTNVSQLTITNCFRHYKIRSNDETTSRDLTDEALSWWETTTITAPSEKITWKFYVEEFKKKYISEQYLNDRRSRSLHLKQANKSIEQYVAEFCKYCKYVAKYIKTEKDKCRKFTNGLNDDLCPTFTAMEIDDFQTLVNQVTATEAKMKAVEKRKSGHRNDKKQKWDDRTHRSSKKANYHHDRSSAYTSAP
ncbi:hypothetical protein GQ457_17G011340 [Hibiscus cannabinus]